MATIFTVNFSSSSNNKLRLNVSELNVTTTSRTISWSLQMCRGSGWDSYNYDDASYSVKIGSKSYSSSDFNFDARNWTVGSFYTIASDSFSVSHSSGAFSLSCSASVSTGVGFGSASSSGTFTGASINYIAYNANGGSGAPSTTYFVYGGSATSISTTIPTRSGYNFLGWSTSKTATSASYYAGQSWSSSNSSYELFAVWEVANNKSTFVLSNNTINLDSSTTMFINSMVSSNTHTITLTLPTGSYTLATSVGASYTWTMPASTWAEYFTDSKSIDGTITLTTYSGSTTMGSDTQGVILVLPESLGKPDKPTVILSSERSANITIDLKKPVFKYGAIFKEWQVETNIGKAKVVGNRVHASVDPTVNKTAVVTICAVDSRGYMSDPVSIPWHKRKVGASIFVNGKWVSCEPHVYENGAWIKHKEPYVYLDEKDLVSKDGFELADADDLELRGDDIWQSIH